MDEILFRYYINTAVLVYIHISNTQKWASGSDPTLLFWKRAERRKIYLLYD